MNQQPEAHVLKLDKDLSCNGINDQTVSKAKGRKEIKYPFKKKKPHQTSKEIMRIIRLKQIKKQNHRSTSYWAI